MALDDINRNNSVLPNYDLKSVIYNGMCKSDVVMKTFINVIMNKESKSVIGFLGKFFFYSMYNTCLRAECPRVSQDAILCYC